MHFLETALEPGDITEQAWRLLRAATPEGAKKLQEIIAEKSIEIHLVDGDAADLGSIFGVVQIPRHFIVRMWILAHAGWEALRDYGSILFASRLQEYDIEPGDIKRCLQEMKIHPRSADAVAFASRTEMDLRDWPAWIPEFQAQPTNVETHAIKELWAMAVAWCLLHEVRHAMFFKDNDQPDESIEEERLCDDFALRALIDGVNSYAEATQEPEDKVRGKRAMGILVGLYVVASLTKHANDSHPLPSERVVRLLNDIDGLPSANFWNFSSGLIYTLAAEGDTLRLPYTPDVQTTVLSLAKAL